MGTSNAPTTGEKPQFAALARAGFAIGFGAGGFFDGILLHQILQWHHLLSGIKSQPALDLRFQVMADGFFHALMYAVAAAGLWMLWRCRRACAQPGSGRTLLTAALAGFGGWHVVDGVLSHWVLGIHRIRMDVDDPLLWDLIWFLVFGIAFLLAGWMIARRPGRGNGRTAALMLVPAMLLLGGLSSLPPAGTPATLVLFAPQTSPREAFAAVKSSGAKVLWMDVARGLWIVRAGNANPLQIYCDGALWLAAPLLPAGCLNWTKFNA